MNHFVFHPHFSAATLQQPVVPEPLNASRSSDSQRFVQQLAVNVNKIDPVQQHHLMNILILHMNEVSDFNRKTSY